MHQSRLILDASTPLSASLLPADRYMNGFSALSAFRFDFGVDVQRGRNAERVPGAIGEIGFVVSVYFESSLHARKRIGDQDAMRAGLQEKRMALMKRLISGGGLLVSQSEAFRSFLHTRRTSGIRKMLVDKGANIPESVVVHTWIL